MYMGVWEYGSVLEFPGRRRHHRHHPGQALNPAKRRLSNFIRPRRLPLWRHLSANLNALSPAAAEPAPAPAPGGDAGSCPVNAAAAPDSSWLLEKLPLTCYNFRRCLHFL